MDANLYREVILDHWRNPKHFGKLKGATHRSFVENTLCGDAIGWYLEIIGDTIKHATFYGDGCALSIAGASIIAAAIQEKSLKQAKQLTGAWVKGELQIEPGPAREQCVMLGLEAFKKAIEGVQ